MPIHWIAPRPIAGYGFAPSRAVSMRKLAFGEWGPVIILSMLTTAISKAAYR